MKKLLLFAILIIVVNTSCEKDEDIQIISQELTTIEDLSHEDATELLRLNILSEYGGIFRLLELYHSMVFDEGLPCDSVFNANFIDASAPDYSLNIPMEINTDCTKAVNVYNDRKYRSFHENGTQTAESETFAVEVRINDQQTIAGNSEEDVYTYFHHGNRDILITKGMAAELEPTAKLNIFIPSCSYDRINVVLTDVTEPNFELEIRTNEGSPIPLSRKNYAGTIKKVGGQWTVFFDDGEEVIL